MPFSPAQKFCGECGTALRSEATAPTYAPEHYIPKHLAEKILTSRASLDGERIQSTRYLAARGDPRTPRRGRPEGAGGMEP
jgi:hypothetical protein